jgi:hypothetical protein
VCSEGQFHSICFDLSSGSDLYPYTLLLKKLSSYDFSAAYVNWLCTHLTNIACCVRFVSVFSSPFLALSGVPQRCRLQPLLLNTYSNDLSKGKVTLSLCLTN